MTPPLERKSQRQVSIASFFSPEKVRDESKENAVGVPKPKVKMNSNSAKKVSLNSNEVNVLIPTPKKGNFLHGNNVPHIYKTSIVEPDIIVFSEDENDDPNLNSANISRNIENDPVFLEKGNEDDFRPNPEMDESTLDLTESSTSSSNPDGRTPKRKCELDQDEGKDLCIEKLDNTPVAASKGKPSKKRKKYTTGQAAESPKNATKSKCDNNSPSNAEAVHVPDAITQSRIDAYLQKAQEISTQFSGLLNGIEEPDDIMQDILGCGKDISLELLLDQEHGRSILQALEGMKQSCTDYPDELREFIARSIQGRQENLSVLADLIVKSIKNLISVEENTDLSGCNLLLERSRIEMEVKMLAQRISYGHRPKNANIYEDAMSHAMWIWEVGSLEKFFSEESQRVIKKMRKNRRRVGQHVRNLYRLVQLLGHTIVDECKVSTEEAKVAKFVLFIEAEQQKAKERERKEQEKVQAQLEKKRLEMERQKAKSAEKAKRALELEKEKIQSSKRRKSLVSYFRSIDSTGNGCNPGTIVSGDCCLNECISKTMKNSEDADIKMARMDAAIGLSAAGVTTQLNETFNIPLFKKVTEKTSSGESVWSGKRTKHSVHGIMKLLQFHENHRPAYYGTFSLKNASVFKRGRRPFAQHATFDYAIDSDEEWEEEEPGESLSDADSDNEESEGEDNLDYDDRWLAYEDEVDYLDEENSEGDDDSTKMDKDSARKQVQLKGKDLKHPKLSKIQMTIIGPHVCLSRDCTEHFHGLYQGQLLQTPSFESPLVLKAAMAQQNDKAIQSEKLAKVDSSIREPLESPEKNITMEKSSNQMLTTWLHNNSEHEGSTDNAIEI